MVTKEQAKRLAEALRDELCFTASPELVGVIEARSYVVLARTTLGDELAQVVWRALEVAELSDPAEEESEAR